MIEYVHKYVNKGPTPFQFSRNRQADQSKGGFSHLYYIQHYQ